MAQEQVQENEAVQEFLKLLMENMPSKGQDYSTMLWQVDGMARQLEQALAELQAVKEELGKIQENPVKRAVSRIVQSVEQKIHALQERLSDVKDAVIENAKQAVESVKQTGVSALDKTVSFLGVGKALNAMQEDLSRTMADTQKSIEKIETIGHELRSVGGHLKNVGRAATGKEQQIVDGGKEGRFQTAVLAPMRTVHKILSHMNNTALAAIGGVERLEQAAKQNRAEPDKEKPELPEEAKPEHTVELDAPAAPRKAEPKEKPSVLKDLQEKKIQAAAHTAPVPDKAKVAEAAL